MSVLDIYLIIIELAPTRSLVYDTIFELQLSIAIRLETPVAIKTCCTEVKRRCFLTIIGGGLVVEGT